MILNSQKVPKSARIDDATSSSSISIDWFHANRQANHLNILTLIALLWAITPSIIVQLTQFFFLHIANFLLYSTKMLNLTFNCLKVPKSAAIRWRYHYLLLVHVAGESHHSFIMWSDLLKIKAAQCIDIYR